MNQGKEYLTEKEGIEQGIEPTYYQSKDHAQRFANLVNESERTTLYYPKYDRSKRKWYIEYKGNFPIDD